MTSGVASGGRQPPSARPPAAGRHIRVVPTDLLSPHFLDKVAAVLMAEDDVGIDLDAPALITPFSTDTHLVLVRCAA
jgi:hypothetical protein